MTAVAPTPDALRLRDARAAGAERTAGPVGVAGASARSNPSSESSADFLNRYFARKAVLTGPHITSHQSLPGMRLPATTQETTAAASGVAAAPTSTSTMRALRGTGSNGANANGANANGTNGDFAFDALSWRDAHELGAENASSSPRRTAPNAFRRTVPVEATTVALVPPRSRASTRTMALAMVMRSPAQLQWALMPTSLTGPPVGVAAAHRGMAQLSDARLSRVPEAPSAGADHGQTKEPDFEGVETSDMQTRRPDPLQDTELVVYQDMSLGDILREKEMREVLWISETATIFEAIEMMNANRVGALVVKNSEGKVAGIITERDYMTKVALRGRSSRESPVRQIMTTDVKFGRANHSCRDTLKLMTEHRFRHLPVLNDSHELVGLISIGDLVKTILTDLAETAMNYRDYIVGNYRYSASQASAKEQEKRKEELNKLNITG